MAQQNAGIGNNDYQSKVSDLEGIFAKLQGIIDVGSLYAEFFQVRDDAQNDPKLKKGADDISHLDTFANDYENFMFIPYVKRLEDIERKLIQLLPFYELHLLTSSLKLKVDEINCNNVNEVIKEGKKLLDAINELNSHNHPDKNKLLAKAYEVLYSAILHEQIFDRSDILTYVNYLNIPINRESLGRLLEKDLNHLSEKDLLDERLKTLRTEGLGYDFLSEAIIRKVSQKTVGEKNSEYQEKKAQAIHNIMEKTNAFVDYRNELESALNEIKSGLRHATLLTGALFAKMASVILIPIVTIYFGNMLGRIISSSTLEYETVTRTINLETGSVIGEPEISYDEHETTYVATILKCGPWKKNPAGVGYIHNVVAYEYIVPDDISEGFSILDDEDILANAVEKYRYSEPKDVLDENDSQEETTFLAVETYQNKDSAVPSTKFVIPFTIGGGLLGLAIDVLLILLRIYGYEETKEKISELNQEIHTGRVKRTEIEDKLKEMKKEALDLSAECEDVIQKYGLDDGEITIDPSWLENSARKRQNKNK